MDTVVEVEREKTATPLFSILVATALCILVYATWWSLDAQREDNLRNLVEMRASRLSAYLQADIRARVPAVNRIVKRWENRGGTPEDEFREDVGAYVEDLPGFQAIEWVDKSFTVCWIVPLAGNEQAQGLNLAFEQSRRSALEAAKSKNVFTMTSPIDLVQGGKGFLIYFPLMVDDEFDGFILAVFKIDEWLDYVFHLRYSTEESNNFRVALSIDGQSVFKQYTSDAGAIERQANVVTEIMGRSFTLNVVPTDTFFDNNISSTPEAIALFGLLVTALISIMVFLYQRSNVAIRNEHAINIALEKSIDEQRRAELEAISANQAKLEFLSSMSHELRTPLNSILGFSQLLETNKENPLNQDQKDSVNYISQGGKHLLELINDVLDLAKIEAGKAELSIDDIKLEPIIDQCFELTKSMAIDNNIELKKDYDTTDTMAIRADNTRTKQILLNLLSNAIKYNRPGGSVTVSYHEISTNTLRVEVVDTGKGIQEERQHELFKPFNRLGAEMSDVQGTGIGLSVCKNLVELMDGRIGVESNAEVGSTFWFELPMVESQPGTTANSAMEPVIQSGQILPTTINASILYVEDNEPNIHLMEAICDAIEGLTLLTTKSAEEGIKVAKAQAPDIIIFDVNLPGMSGIEAMEYIHQAPETQNIPVIGLSAAAMQKDIDRGLSAGFNLYLTKPIEVEKLVNAIEELMRPDDWPFKLPRQHQDTTPRL